MKRQVVLDIKGNWHTWSVEAYMSDAQIADMRTDGVDVGIVQNVVPERVHRLGLTRSWLALQNIYNLRFLDRLWPFHPHKNHSKDQENDTPE